MFKLAAVMALVAGPAFATGLEIDVGGEANGTIKIDLFEDTAPLHVAQIVAIAQAGDYDGVVFHRVIEGFMAQTGDVEFGKGEDTSRAGMGGSALPDIPAEFSDIADAQRPHRRIANLDLLRRQPRKHVARQRRCSASCQNIARFWPGQNERANLA